MIEKYEVELLMEKQIQRIIEDKITKNATNGKTVTVVTFDKNQWPTYIMDRVIKSLVTNQFKVEIDTDSVTEITIVINLQ